MLIKFTHDFRGKLTNENFYLEGSELEVTEDVGLQLVELGHAVDVTPEPDPPAPEPKKAPEKVEGVEEEGDGEFDQLPDFDPDVERISEPVKSKSSRRSSKPKKGTSNA